MIYLLLIDCQLLTSNVIIQVMKAGLEPIALYKGVMYSINSSVSARNNDN